MRATLLLGRLAWGRAFVAVLCASGAMLAFVSPASAAVAACVPFDLSGDGLPDLAVGIPGEDVGSAANAGAVNVLYGKADGSYGGGVYLTQEQLGQKSQASDSLGAALVVADVSADGCADLIVGVPGENRSTGQVLVAYGSTAGIAGGRVAVLRQGLSGAAGTAEAGDRFGAAVSVDPGYEHERRKLWVGAPGEDVGSLVDAGAVVRFSAYRLTTNNSSQMWQGHGDIPGVAEAGDQFGASLAGGGTLIGSPGEDVGSKKDAGSVVQTDESREFYWTVTQDSNGIPDVAESGDRFGAAVASREGFCETEFGPSLVTLDLIGAPGEDTAAGVDAGAVIRVTGGSQGDDTGPEWRPWVSIPGADEAGDRYGAALELSDSRIIIGVPGEDVGTVKDAGEVVTYPYSLWCDVGFEFDWGVKGGPRNGAWQGDETGDVFGSKIGVLSADAFAVAAPGESVSGRAAAGAVSVVDLARGKVRQYHQDTPGVPGAAETDDWFSTLTHG